MKDTGKSLINKIEKLQGRYYFFVTEMSTGKTWISDAAADYFQLKDEYYEDFYSQLEQYVHPFDLNEYKEGIQYYLRLEELEDEFCIRLVMGQEVCLYSFLMDKLEIDGETYLLIILKNVNIGPDIDYLTSLYSVSRFESDLKFAMENKEKCVLLHVDINHMDDIDMIYGQMGSRSICHDIATMYIYMMDEHKAVYRVTDTGFTFLLRNDDRETAEDFSKKVREVIEELVVFNGKRLSLRCSMAGLVLKDFDDNLDTIIGKLKYTADISRNEKRGRLVFFNDLVKINENTDLSLLKIIYSSVQNDCDGFYLDYQPIVSAKDGSIVGAESLLRWKKDPYGVIPPGVFIDWMEGSSAMYELGNFVLKRALTEAKDFVQIHEDFFINVNISEKQIERHSFRDDVEKIIEETGFPRNNICLELTERCKYLPLDMLKKEVEYLKNSGIRVALDDYGTGSASSSVVLGVPVDEIKIDMSFIRGIQHNIRQQALVKNMINFANQAGLYSCIEGVEDEELEQFLKSYGATWFQGYYYSKPVSKEKLVKML